MPELPEVETSLRGLKPFVDNKTIESIEVRQDQLRWPVPVNQLHQLHGLKVERFYRRAKYLILQTSKGSVLLHLGMSGSLRVLSPKSQAIQAPEKHDHVDIVFTSGYVARLNDPRKFGCVLFTNEGIDQHKLIASLGPEPLSADFNADYLFRLSRKRAVAVKNFIMNGHIVVGVGNIYASEALFISGIRPTKKVGSLSKKQSAALVDAIKQVLAKAIEAGGTTLNDFLQADGKPGYFSQELQVYGRADQPCFICSTPIKSLVIGQRNTFYCPNCQK